MSQQTQFANPYDRIRVVGIAAIVTAFLLGGSAIAAGPASAANYLVANGETDSQSVGDDDRSDADQYLTFEDYDGA